MQPGVRNILFLVLIGGIAASSSARNADGTLGLLRTPHNGRPAIISSGGSFEVLVEEEASLHLSGVTGVHPLEVSWSPEPGTFKRGHCLPSVPLPPGTYTLHAETDKQSDANARSVYVVEDFPSTYQFAHLTDTHIGTTRHPRADTEIFQDLIEAINTSESFFVLITGDLTEGGTPEQFSRFIEILDSCRIPTFVVPGNHDRQDHNYDLFLGLMTYVFSFGEDGYLAFDTKDFLVADEMSPQDGLLYFYRRQIRASRWSIGFTHRYDVTMGMRAQLCLFVDDPLDCLLYGHYHREPGDGDGIPWGHTQFIMTPAAINGMLRFITVDTTGVHAQETITAAVIHNEGE